MPLYNKYIGVPRPGRFYPEQAAVTMAGITAAMPIVFGSYGTKSKTYVEGLRSYGDAKKTIINQTAPGLYIVEGVIWFNPYGATGTLGMDVDIYTNGSAVDPIQLRLQDSGGVAPVDEYEEFLRHPIYSVDGLKVDITPYVKGGGVRVYYQRLGA